MDARRRARDAATAVRAGPRQLAHRQQHAAAADRVPAEHPRARSRPRRGSERPAGESGVRRGRQADAGAARIPQEEQRHGRRRHRRRRLRARPPHGQRPRGGRDPAAARAADRGSAALAEDDALGRGRALVHPSDPFRRLHARRRASAHRDLRRGLGHLDRRASHAGAASVHGQVVQRLRHAARAGARGH